MEDGDLGIGNQVLSPAGTLRDCRVCPPNTEHELHLGSTDRIDESLPSWYIYLNIID